MDARKLAMLTTVGLLASLALGSSATGQSTPTLTIVGFASTLGDGKNTPRVEAKNGGTITKCRDKKALSAVFLIGGIGAGSRYQQYWSSTGKTVFLGKTSMLSGGIASARVVYMGFTKEAALKNGKYIFQFILNGRPHVLGSVTRRC